MEAGRHRGDLTPDEIDKMTSAEIFDLLDKVEDAIGVVRLYVADSLLHPSEGNEGDAGR